jgi:hypothetical protein
MALLFVLQTSAQPGFRIFAFRQAHQKGGAVGQFLAPVRIVATCATAYKNVLAMSVRICCARSAWPRLRALGQHESTGNQDEHFWHSIILRPDNAPYFPYAFSAVPR